MDKLTTQITDIIERKTEEHEKPLVVYIEGGHFDPRMGPDEFSRVSLEEMLNLAGKLIKDFKKRIRIVLGVLVDDLGASGDHTDELPEEIESILGEKWFVKRDKLLVTGERNAKNRGLNRLPGALEESDALVHDEEDGVVYFETSDDQNARIGRLSDESKAAFCPTIMAQHYADVVAALDVRFNREMYPKLLVDFSRMNDWNKVRRGAELAVRVFMPDDQDVEIVNIFLTDLGDRECIIKQHSLEQYND